MGTADSEPLAPAQARLTVKQAAESHERFGFESLLDQRVGRRGGAVRATRAVGVLLACAVRPWTHGCPRCPATT